MRIPLSPHRVVSQVKWHVQKPLLQLNRLRGTMSQSSKSVLVKCHQKCLILPQHSLVNVRAPLVCLSSSPYGHSLSELNVCSLFTAPIHVLVIDTMVVPVYAPWELYTFVQCPILFNSQDCLSWGKPWGAVVLTFLALWHPHLEASPPFFKPV